MQSKATDVDAYLAEVPEARHEALSALRRLCLDTLTGYREEMAYGMPSYRREGGEPEVSFASQKNHIALYILKKPVLDRYRAELVTASIGKGCIRFSAPEKLDFEVIEKLLVATRESDDRIC